MSTYVTIIANLLIGELYELRESDWRIRVPWFCDSMQNTSIVDLVEVSRQKAV